MKGLRIFLDGDSWCVLYGRDLQSGICGFGSTTLSAMAAFDRQWQLASQPKKQEAGQ
jgi:hypothetical protein